MPLSGIHSLTPLADVLVLHLAGKESYVRWMEQAT